LGADPDYSYAHYRRACVYATLGQTEAALKDLKQSIQLSSAYLEEARVDESLESLRVSGKLDELIGGGSNSD